MTLMSSQVPELRWWLCLNQAVQNNGKTSCFQPVHRLTQFYDWVFMEKKNLNFFYRSCIILFHFYLAFSYRTFPRIQYVMCPSQCFTSIYGLILLIISSILFRTFITTRPAIQSCVTPVLSWQLSFPDWWHGNWTQQIFLSFTSCWRARNYCCDGCYWGRVLLRLNYYHVMVKPSFLILI